MSSRSSSNGRKAAAGKGRQDRGPSSTGCSDRLQSSFFRAAVLAVALLLSIGCARANAQIAGDLGAFAGRWQLSLSKSKLLKYGPHGKNDVRAATYTFIFTPQHDWLRLNIYAQYPQPKPIRTIDIVPDGKPHPCIADCAVSGVQDGQTYTYSVIDPHLVARTTHVRGKAIEYNTYAVSADGKALTMITWNAETPEWQNIYVFEKQQ